MESRVRPFEHPLSRLDVHQLTLNEHREHRAAEGLGESGDIMERQMDESAVWPKTAVGDKQVQMGVPVREGAVGLDR